MKELITNVALGTIYFMCIFRSIVSVFRKLHHPPPSSTKDIKGKKFSLENKIELYM